MTSSLWVGVSTLWVSTFLYGIYLVLFCRCMYIFYKTGMKRSGSRSAALPLLLSAIIMFILSTITVLLFLLQGATAYGAYAISEEAANQRVEGLELAGAVVYVTNNLLADALLIYRCYIIWNTIWITLVPLILLIATMSELSECPRLLSTYNQSPVLGYAIELRLFFILSLTINLFVPTLVAGRLWWVIRRIRSPSGQATRKKGKNAMVIILESGLIYSIFVSIHMGFFHFQNPLDAVIYAALGQVVGIVPTLIIVRVGLGVSQNGNGRGSTMESGSPVSPRTIDAAPSQSSTIAVSPSTDSEKAQMQIQSGWDAETVV
ncbi:hypothetical protein FB45DRAFT_363809 [Roridomyces roridus]|uniref:Uncharacterized protein n=1 Tax=Roridomyces roridus TaxID=1738132 RepID=A0AAD7FTC9_9AGAR|nr:hypothetical protein FB45DRAFT_363809 [Roridomyces roridus]